MRRLSLIIISLICITSVFAIPRIRLSEMIRVAGQGGDDPETPDAWVLEVGTTGDAQAFRVDITTASDIVIDWGDGSVSNVPNGNVNISHTYATASTNEVRITGGSAARIWFSQVSPQRTRLIGVKYPLKGITGITSFQSTFFSTSISDIPLGMFDFYPDVTTFSSCFNAATRITNVPDNLFAYNNKVTSFDSTFLGCTSLTSIGTNVFNTQGAVSYWQTFLSCSALHNIPGDLFANSTNAIRFGNSASVSGQNGTFASSGVTNIPAELFAYNTEASYFVGVFQNTPITEIPKNLFIYNTKAISFNNCFQGTAVSEIPVELFANNTNATSFSSCFASLAVTNVPDNLFAYNNKVTSFDSTFASCTSLVNIGTNVFNTQGAVSYWQTFMTCSNLENIPEDLFRNSPNAIRFGNSFVASGQNGTFAGSGITNIPAGLFTNATKATHFVGVFSHTPITTIPSGLFDKATNATSLSGCLASSAVTNVPDNLFAYNDKVTDYDLLFNSCTSLVHVGTNVFNSQGSARFAQTFSSCLALQSIPADLFFNVPNAVSFGYSTVVSRQNGTFAGSGLTSIPPGLFDNNLSVTHFVGTFSGCTALDYGGPIVLGGTELWDRSPAPTGTSFVSTTTHATFRAIVPVVWGGTL